MFPLEVFENHQKKRTELVGSPLAGGDGELIEIVQGIMTIPTSKDEPVGVDFFNEAKQKLLQQNDLAKRLLFKIIFPCSKMVIVHVCHVFLM